MGVEFKEQSDIAGEAGLCIGGKTDHHWELGEPQGPTTVGNCNKCGQTKEFLNGSNDYVPDERGRRFLTSTSRMFIDHNTNSY